MLKVSTLGASILRLLQCLCFWMEKKDDFRLRQGVDVMTWVWGHMDGKEKARMDGGSKRFGRGPRMTLDGWRPMNM